MKKILFLISSFSALATVAAAGTVTFSTGGVFDCHGLSGCSVSGNTVNNNGATLTYAPVLTSGALTAPTFTNFGSLTEGGASGVDFTGITFTLTINQTVPVNGQGSLSAAQLTGLITSGTNSTASIAFQAPTFSVTIGAITDVGPGVQVAGLGGPVTYIVTNNPLGLVALSSGGTTTIQGAVSDSPEPVTFVLVGAGLGLAGLLRRRSA